MRSAAMLFAVMVLVFSTSVHAQMTTLPEKGKLLGYASMDTSGRWLVFGPDGLKPIQPTVVDGGKAIFYQGVAGEYAIIFLPPDNADQPVVHTQILGGGTPDPPNPPKPPVPTSDIATKVRELFAKVSGGTRSSEAKALAAMYQSLAEEIETAADPLSTTELVTPQAALSRMATDARAVLGGRRDAWNAWFDEMAPFMNELFKDGKLPRTVFGVGKAFAEIAKGLNSLAAQSAAVSFAPAKETTPAPAAVTSDVQVIQDGQFLEYRQSAPRRRWRIFQ